MSKRAGRRTHRMGSQRHPPGATKKPHTLIEDNLRPAESLSIELQAARSGWMIQDEGYDKVRALLLRKLVSAGASAADPMVLCKIVRTVAMIEQRQEALEIARSRANAMPEPLLVDAGRDQPAPFEVIQQLIQKREVRDAIDPTIAELVGYADSIKLGDSDQRRTIPIGEAS